MLRGKSDSSSDWSVWFAEKYPIFQMMEVQVYKSHFLCSVNIYEVIYVLLNTC